MLEHGILAHPENASRLAAILKALQDSSYVKFLDLSINRKATVAELSEVHDIDYINYVLLQDGKQVNLDPETPMSQGSVQAALVAAGLGLELVERVVEGTIENGFALVRPPGHHAEGERALGFCVFNNIAVAAKKALNMGLKRIMIVDWDVHHANGTQSAFYDDDRVFLVDMHQDNLFPVNSGLLSETGAGKGLGFTANIPFPDSCRDADYLYAFDTIIEPLAKLYRPELILVSAGFDAHESDPLGSMSLTTKAYAALSARVKALAKELCGGKLIFFLEGGYNPAYLAQNVLECVKVLVSSEVMPQEKVEPYTFGMQKHIQEIYDVHVKPKLPNA